MSDHLPSALKIERGIPIPQNGRNGRTWGLSAVLRKMKPKESVFVPNADPLNTCRTASRIGGLTKAKFVTRRVDGGVRIWRVS